MRAQVCYGDDAVEFASLAMIMVRPRLKMGLVVKPEARNDILQLSALMLLPDGDGARPGRTFLVDSFSHTVLKQ